MNTTPRLCVAVLALSCIALGAAAPSAFSARSGSAEFTRLRMHLEVDLPNAPQLPLAEPQAVDLLDLPAEIVLEAISERPLRVLRVVSPGGSTVLGLGYSRGAGLAGSEISMETEGKSLREVLARYPVGTYKVHGLTWDGDSISGSVELSAHFPGQFTAGFEGKPRTVQIQSAELSWSPSRLAESYQLEIESESLNAEFSVRLPASATSFLIPVQLLAPDATYEYSLSVKGDTDNELEVEGSFTTAP